MARSNDNFNIQEIKREREAECFEKTLFLTKVFHTKTTAPTSKLCPIRRQRSSKAATLPTTTMFKKMMMTMAMATATSTSAVVRLKAACGAAQSGSMLSGRLHPRWPMLNRAHLL